MDIPIRFVLLETSHPGNIGASARAMKTMGLSDLVLVAPARYPAAEATARASGADDVLARARVVDSLAEAISDCSFVLGASARPRSLAWPTLEPRQAAQVAWQEASHGQVAMVFGPEKSGLDNEHLARCQQLVQIPANPDYSSLNLAMAVQVISYELRMAAAERLLPEQARETRLATGAELEHFHDHLREVLLAAGFLNPAQPRALLLRLRRLFNRAALDKNEVNILEGMLSALDPKRISGR
jgi:TrmH family RNA methyltransferase